jgi:predicted RNA polymerase sigma factor
MMKAPMDNQEIEMEYLILEANDHPEMMVKVNKAVASGYRPQGGIAAYTVIEPVRDSSGHVYETYHYIWFMQAMIKEAPKC